MLQEFINQNYLIIEQNIVTNITVWNGDTSQWTPPQGSIAIVQATTTAITWLPVIVDGNIIDWALGEKNGAGDIGFTWDGTVLTTNQPKPTPPAPKADQPTTTGTTTI